MPATALTICNAALIKLGAKTITAFTDSRKEAELVSARYPRLRDSMLRGHTWTFAKAVETSNSSTVSNVAIWAYEHFIDTLANPLGRILSITDAEEQPIEYELAGTSLYCDHTAIVIRYIRRYEDLDDEVQFPDDFGEALAALLAADICISLTQTQALRETYYQEYLMLLSNARFNGAVELSPRVVQATAWTDAHDRGSSTDYPTLLA